MAVVFCKSQQDGDDPALERLGNARLAVLLRHLRRAHLAAQTHCTAGGLGGLHFRAENLERLADQWVALEFLHRIELHLGRRLRDARGDDAIAHLE